MTSGGEAAAAYGTRFDFGTHNQATSYNIADGIPWTEYIEVSYADAVYAVCSWQIVRRICG